MEEKDTVKMLKDTFINKAPRLTMTDFSSANLETPIVAQESYLLTVDVKSIGLTESQAHVTSKMLILITKEDQIYSIENALWSARRESKAETEAKAARELEKATTLPTPGYKINQTEEQIIDLIKFRAETLVSEGRGTYVRVSLQRRDRAATLCFSKGVIVVDDGDDDDDDDDDYY